MTKLQVKKLVVFLLMLGCMLRVEAKDNFWHMIALVGAVAFAHWRGMLDRQEEIDRLHKTLNNLFNRYSKEEIK